MIRGFKLTVCSLTLLALSACQQLSQRPGDKIPLELLQVPPPPPEEAEATPPAERPAGQPLTEAEITLGRGTLIQPPRLHRAAREPGKYTLNFDDADLSEVLKVVFGDILKQNYLLSPKAGGKITLHTTRPLRRDEVLPALEMALRTNGLVLVKRKDFYWIGAADEATPGAPLTLGGGPLPPGYQIRIFPLRYVGADSMKKVLKPLLSPKAILHVDEVRNLLMVAGSAEELAGAEETVRTFDINYLKGMSVGLFPLKNLDAETLIQDLKKALGEKVLQDTSLLRLLPIERLNALMVITTQPEYLELAQKWVKRLDRAIVEEAGAVHVYRVQNVDAVKLAETLNQIFTGKRGRKPAAKLAPGLKKAKVGGKNRSTRGTPGKLKGEIRIIADEPNNSLIIIADQEDYRAIERVVKQLDKLPLQVLIDASIIEVTLTDDLQYGLEWFAQNKLPKQHSVTGFSSQGLDLSEAAKGVLLNTLAPGFTYVWQSKSQDIGVILKAAAEKGKLNVISSPSLMVLNNHEATIVVGEQISLRTSEVVNTGSAGANPLVTQTFQQRDTGVQLKIKPRVNAGGLVIMELDQRVDDIGRRLEGNPNPNIIQRQIKSTVAVKDGDTLVLGGLIKDNRNKNRTGIPFLYNLPVIGHLFGTTTENVNRTELVVLITPRVVQSRHDAYAVTNEFRLRLKELYQTPERYLKQPRAKSESQPET